jgi:hypothetical protein
MKVGDLIKVNLPNASMTLHARLRHGQLGVLIEEPSLFLAAQWKVFVDGKVYWLYPDYFEVQE